MNLSLIADQTDPNKVYIGGMSNDQNTGNIRFYDPTSNSWQPLIFTGANGTPTHADSRNMAWDANGNLLECDDGGIYRLLHSHGDDKRWESVSGTMNVHEVYAVARVPFGHGNLGFVAGLQDNGTAQEVGSGLQIYADVSGGDGGRPAVDYQSDPNAIYIYSQDNHLLNFNREKYGQDGINIQDFTHVGLKVDGTDNVSLNLSKDEKFLFDPNLLGEWALNSIDGTRMIFASDHLYESFDRGDHVTPLEPLKDAKPDPAASLGEVSALAYGGTLDGVPNPDLLYAAAGGNLYIKTGGTLGVRKVTYPTAGKGAMDIVLDPTDWRIAYMLDSNGHVFRTTDGGNTLGNWTDITGDLGTVTGETKSIELYKSGATTVLLVGGFGGVFRALNPSATSHWRQFGNFMPNVLVMDVHYDPVDDLLYAGTFGRGIATIENAGAYLTAPSVLTITGDFDHPNEADHFTLDHDPNNPRLIEITYDGEGDIGHYEIEPAVLDQIIFKGGGGNDTYDINATDIPTTIDVGTANAIVHLGGNGDLSKINSPVSIIGSGTTRLVLDDHADTSSGKTIKLLIGANSGAISGLTPTEITYDGRAHITSVQILLNTGGSDTVSIAALGIPTEIVDPGTNVGFASNGFMIGVDGTMDQITAALTVRSAEQLDSLSLDLSSKLGTLPLLIEEFTPAGDATFGKITGGFPGSVSFEMDGLSTATVQTPNALNAVVVYGSGEPPKQIQVNSQPGVSIRNVSDLDGLVATDSNNLHVLNCVFSSDVSITGGSGDTFDQITMTNLTMAGVASAVFTNSKVRGKVKITDSSAVDFEFVTNVTTLTATNVAGLFFNHGSAASVTLTGGTSAATFTFSTISGAVLVDGGAGHRFDSNPTIGSMTITGGADSPVVIHNHILGTLTFSDPGPTNVTITNNHIGRWDNLTTVDGIFDSNDVDVIGPMAQPAVRTRSINANPASVGIDLEAPFIGPISHNTVHGASIGVYYGVPAQLFANQIYGNTTGVVMPVNDITGRPGIFPRLGANDIFNNVTGVNLTGRMQLQHIYSNTTGVIGQGILGGSSLDTANLIETNTVGVNFVGTIQYNRIDRNTTGILGHNAQIVVHNLIYRNTGDGIRTNGASDVRIDDNTFYMTSGSGVRADGGLGRVELLDNIFQADGGYDVFVADDSRSGFFSDYNDLYSTGTGKLFHYFIDFSDILDLQRDVNTFDLHSIGTSAVNPGYARSRGS